MKRNMEDTYRYITVILFWALIGILTTLHDPVLHSIAAWFIGWDILAYQTGATTGSTEVIAMSNTLTSTNILIFFLLPSTFLITSIFILTFYKPNYYLAIVGALAFALNFASFDPSNRGSDAFNAIQHLTKIGWNEADTTLYFWLLFLFIGTLYATYIRVIVENNSKDMKRRIKATIH